MRHYLFLLSVTSLLLTFISCSQDGMGPQKSTPSAVQPTPVPGPKPFALHADYDKILADAAVANSLDEAQALLSKIGSGDIRAHSSYDFGRAKDTTARSIILDGEIAQAFLPKFQAKLGAGLIAFVGNGNWRGDEKPQGNEFVIAPGTQQSDIIKLARTKADKAGKTTEDLVGIFERWDKDFGITITHAEADSLDLILKSKPKDLPAFAKEVVELCPSLQMNASQMEKELKRADDLHFLWY